MPAIKRRGRSKSQSRSKRLRTALAAYNRRQMKRPVVLTRTVTSRVNKLYRMIETKEQSRKSNLNVALAHNNVYVVVDGVTGGSLNPFQMGNGAEDIMGTGGTRVGDQISIKGVMVKGFFENALARPKTYYRVMLLRGAKGETFDRSSIFKGDSNNKMIDQVNTERFTIVAQKIFNINASNVAASGAEVPSGAPITATAGGIGSRTFKMWVPGYKFGRGGNIQYENQSSTQVKFFDYRICILVYDWYGTPQDLNTVGRMNELYTKLYFKDA